MSLTRGYVGSTSTSGLILAGKYVQALRQPELQALLGAHDIDGPEEFFTSLQKNLRQQIIASDHSVLQTLLLGAVSCVHIFVQNNLTG